jgi:gas vesicle protein
MNRFLLGGILGALLGVLFAPANGRTTRAKIKDKANKFQNEFSDYVDKKSKHLGNKMQGLNHELSKFSEQAKDKSEELKQQAKEGSQKLKTQMGEKAQELRQKMEQFKQETMDKAAQSTRQITERMQDFTPPSGSKQAAQTGNQDYNPQI